MQNMYEAILGEKTVCELGTNCPKSCWGGFPKFRRANAVVLSKSRVT